MIKRDILFRSIGLAVKERREELGLFMADLAERHSNTRAHAHISKIERGCTDLKISSLFKLADSLETSVINILINAKRISKELEEKEKEKEKENDSNNNSQ